jgi:hypothetical protein
MDGYNQLAGPVVGYTVVYNEFTGFFYPAIITAVDRFTGLIELTTFPPGLGAVDRQSVRSDEDGLASNTWRFLRDNETGPSGSSGGGLTNAALREDGSFELREDGSFALRE